MKLHIKNLTLSGLFLAMCLLLPFVTGQIPEIGKALSPMHIPVFICAFVCKTPYAAAVGLIAPILRSLIFTMPSMFPDAVCMALELCMYGAATGLIYKLLPKKIPFIYVSLVSGMFMGRIVWGIANYLIAGIQNTEFSFSMFIAGAFTEALPGIICHIVLIPALIIALRRTKLIQDK